MWICGLDLGQTNDPTAFVALESVPDPTGTRHSVRHLERAPIGTGYPEIAAAVLDLLARPPLSGATLIVDQTGVGRPVVDLLRPLGRRLVPVTITAGDSATETPTGWRVPKRELVSAVQVPLQQRRLKFAESLPEASVLVRELLNFRVRITEAANDVYGAWREGEHDDLVLALALAVWWAERPRNPLAGIVAQAAAKSGWQVRPRY